MWRRWCDTGISRGSVEIIRRWRLAHRVHSAVRTQEDEQERCQVDTGQNEPGCHKSGGRGRSFHGHQLKTYKCLHLVLLSSKTTIWFVIFIYLIYSLIGIVLLTVFLVSCNKNFMLTNRLFLTKVNFWVLYRCCFFRSYFLLEIFLLLYYFQ